MRIVLLSLLVLAGCGVAKSDPNEPPAHPAPQCDGHKGVVTVDANHAVCDCCAAEGGAGNVCECCDECGCAYVKDPCVDDVPKACPLSLNLFPSAPHKAVAVDACGSELLGRELTDHQDAVCECCGDSCSWRTP